jgi:PAS domain S-box-containing protein
MAPSNSLKIKFDKIARKNNEHLRLLFDNTNMHAICLLSAVGRVESWNKSAEHLLGYIAEEVLGRNYSMFFSKEEIKRQMPRKALIAAAKKVGFRAEGIRVRKDGTFFWASSFITSIKNVGGKPKHFVLITQDITEGKERERQKDEFIGIASHELKNPITTLSLYSELLAERLILENDMENLQMLRDIQSQSALLVTLIDDLLVVNQIDAGRLELMNRNFDLNALIHKVARGIQSTATSHKIVCTGKIKENVSGDYDQIGRVLTNLITNAIKYSPRARRVVIHVSKEKNKAVVSVQDFGLGIEKKDQRQIFKRFFRAQAQKGGKVAGFGLGLFICSEIIKKHKQQIWVQSKYGKGSTFFFSLALV